MFKQIIGFQRKCRKRGKTTAYTGLPKQNHILGYSIPCTCDSDNKSNQNCPDYVGD